MHLDSWSRQYVLFTCLFVCVQVGKLYIRYQLDVADSDEAVVEMEDVICLLKDEKEFYIQKDHLSAKLDICRCVCVFVRCKQHQQSLQDLKLIPKGLNVLVIIFVILTFFKSRTVN